MKTKHFIFTACLLLGILLFSSCLSNDDHSGWNKLYPNALVTVKQASDKTLFLQLDDKTTLFPVNLKPSLFKSKEVRALVNYEEVNESAKAYDRAVRVNWIDTIRTKPMAPNVGNQNNEKYGNDPVEIVRDWVTIAEDGYLTLRFRTLWGYRRTIHSVNLISTNNPDDPYEVVFHHDANGDYAERRGDGLVAFKLDQLPDTKGKTVKLKLKWKSFSGEKTAMFDYCTRAATPTSASIANGRNELPLQ